MLTRARILGGKLVTIGARLRRLGWPPKQSDSRSPLVQFTLDHVVDVLPSGSTNGGARS